VADLSANEIDSLEAFAAKCREPRSNHGRPGAPNDSFCFLRYCAACSAPASASSAQFLVHTQVPQPPVRFSSFQTTFSPISSTSRSLLHTDAQNILVPEQPASQLPARLCTRFLSVAYQSLGHRTEIHKPVKKLEQPTAIRMSGFSHARMDEFPIRYFALFKPLNTRICHFKVAFRIVMLFQLFRTIHNLAHMEAIPVVARTIRFQTAKAPSPLVSMSGKTICPVLSPANRSARRLSPLALPSLPQDDPARRLTPNSREPGCSDGRTSVRGTYDPDENSHSVVL
jgi:hypothetical protein